MDSKEARQLHDTVGYIGLRAQSTAIGLLQLTTELVRAGVLGDDAIQRIKDAILTDLFLSRPRSRARDEYETMLRKRLDALIPLHGAIPAEPVAID